jgi:hypothetical protein
VAAQREGHGVEAVARDGGGRQPKHRGLVGGGIGRPALAEADRVPDGQQRIGHRVGRVELDGLVEPDAGLGEVVTVELVDLRQRPQCAVVGLETLRPLAERRRSSASRTCGAIVDTTRVAI